MKTTIKYIVVAILISNITSISATVTETETSKIGGGGGTYELIACPKGKFVTGIKIKYGDVIDRVKFRCTKMSSQGKWQGSHSWTSYSASNALFPATKERLAECSRDKYVGSVRGKTASVPGFSVLSSLSIGCYNADSTTKNRVGSRQTKTVSGLKSGRNTSWSDCQDGLATKAGVKRGFNLDSLQFRCNKWVSTRSSGGADLAPPEVYPLEHIHPRGTSNAGTLKVKFEKVSGITKYDVCIRQSVDWYQASSRMVATTANTDCFYNKLYEFVGRSRTNTLSITIPSNQMGKMISANIKSCDSTLSCGKNARVGFLWVMPKPPRLISPTNNMTKPFENQYRATKKAEFKWNNVASANDGYQLVIWKTNYSFNDVVIQKGASSYEVNGSYISKRVNGNSLDFTFPDSWGRNNDLKWSVASCVKDGYVSQDRICGKLGIVRQLKFSKTATPSNSKNKKLSCGKSRQLVNGLCVNKNLSSSRSSFPVTKQNSTTKKTTPLSKTSSVKKCPKGKKLKNGQCI